MKSIQQIQQLPQEKREQLMWAIVATTLALLLFLWIATSWIPKPTKRDGNFFTAIRNRALQARAHFSK